MPSSSTSEQPLEDPLQLRPSGYFTDSYIFNWKNQTFRADLILILPIAVCLGVGLWLHHPAAGMIAAGGAMTVGFGAKQNIDESRLLPMLFVTLGMAFAAFRSGTCNCAAPCLKHRIGRLDCSYRETDRNFSAEEPMEESRPLLFIRVSDV